LARARRRNDRNVARLGKDENRFEREGDDFYTRVYEQYRVIASREEHRVITIPDEARIEVIASRILEIVNQRLALLRET
jgi:dTMP kinase